MRKGSWRACSPRGVSLGRRGRVQTGDAQTCTGSEEAQEAGVLCEKAGSQKSSRGAGRTGGAVARGPATEGLGCRQGLTRRSPERLSTLGRVGQCRGPGDGPALARRQSAMEGRRLERRFWKFSLTKVIKTAGGEHSMVKGPRTRPGGSRRYHS